MNTGLRNNIKIQGQGERTIMFSHGYGCDQNMWRYVAPAFEDRYQTVLFDHVGAGKSDLGAYSFSKYGTLQAYADDVIEIAYELGLKNVIFVGHSVSAMIGLMAANQAPGVIGTVIMVAPSPSYINDVDYEGGFAREQIDELLDSLDQNHLGWSMQMAPVIMGNPDRAELSEELANSFCRTDPEIAKHFARVTFLSDCRSILSDVTVPTLILQCTDDAIAPQSVGQYLHDSIRNSTLVQLSATGHCPNLSSPEETADAIEAYLNG